MTLPAAYAPHEAFVAPARARNEIGGLFFGIIAVEFLFGLTLTLLDGVMRLFGTGLAEALFYGDTALGLLAQLFSFALLAACLALVLRRQHNRSLWSALGDPTAAIAALIAAFIGTAALFVVLEVFPPWWRAADLAEIRNPVLWLLSLGPAMLALLIQTGSEELFYRGYIQQQLAARFANPLVWLIVPNLLFAASHFDNGATSTESWQYVIWAFCFGLAASDLTARTGNLGAAIGMHLANNAYAFLLYGEVEGPDSGLALFLFPPEAFGTGAPGPVIDLAFATDLGLVWATWLAARVALRR